MSAEARRPLSSGGPRIAAPIRDATTQDVVGTVNVAGPHMRLTEERMLEFPVEECIKAGIIAEGGADVLVYQIVLIAHGWALKHWCFRSRLTLDAYVAQSLRILFGGALTEKGRRRWAARKTRL